MVTLGVAGNGIYFVGFVINLLYARLFKRCIVRNARRYVNLFAYAAYNTANKKLISNIPVAAIMRNSYLFIQSVYVLGIIFMLSTSDTLLIACCVTHFIVLNFVEHGVLLISKSPFREI